MLYEVITQNFVIQYKTDGAGEVGRLLVSNIKAGVQADHTLLTFNSVITSYSIHYTKLYDVVHIALGSADLLSALAEAKKRAPGAHIGVITGEQLCDQEVITSLVDQPVSVYQVIDEHDVENGLKQLQEQGCTIFVGGLTMCRLC